MYPLYFFIAGLLSLYIGVTQLNEAGFFGNLFKNNAGVSSDKPRDVTNFPPGLRFFCVGLVLSLYGLAEFFDLIDLVGVIVSAMAR